MTCAHHWRIDEPSGPTALGRCLHCNAVREFDTYDPLDTMSYKQMQELKKERLLGKRNRKGKAQ